VRFGGRVAAHKIRESQAIWRILASVRCGSAHFLCRSFASRTRHRCAEFLVETQVAVRALPELLGTLREVTACSTGDGDGVAISEAPERPFTSRAWDPRCADVHDAAEDNEGRRPDPGVIRSRSPYGYAWDKDRDHDPIVPPRPSIEVLPQSHAVRLCDRRLRRALTWLTKCAAPAPVAFYASLLPHETDPQSPDTPLRELKARPMGTPGGE